MGPACDEDEEIAGQQHRCCKGAIFLGAHSDYFGKSAKLARIKAGEGEEVWIDPDGYKATVAEKEHAFERELQRQQGASPSS